MPKKQSYHTNFKIRYRLGLLPEPEIKRVPLSTLRYWDDIDFSLMIGYDGNDPLMKCIDFHRAFVAKTSLLKIAKCMWWLYRTYTVLFEKVRGWKKTFRQQKEEIIQCVQRIAPVLGYERACRMLKISYQRFFRWKQSLPCSSSLLKVCRKLSPQQLTANEQQSVENYLSDRRFFHWPLLARYYQMLHDKAGFMGLQTFYRYAGLLKIKQMLPKKKKVQAGIRSSRPFELLHMDTMIYRLKNLTRVYIHFIMDNFSRSILGHRVSLVWNSRHTVENLKQVCEKYNLYYKPLYLMCDDGSENKGTVDDFLSQPDVEMKRIIAQLEISYSNSMIEAVNKKMKYDFLFTREFESYEELVKFLDRAVEEYNHRYHSALHGLTPDEVLRGAIPDKHLFSAQIQQARKERILKNKQQLCEQCLPANHKINR